MNMDVNKIILLWSAMDVYVILLLSSNSTPHTDPSFKKFSLLELPNTKFVNIQQDLCAECICAENVQRGVFSSMCVWQTALTDVPDRWDESNCSQDLANGSQILLQHDGGRLHYGRIATATRSTAPICLFHLQLWSLERVACYTLVTTCANR